MLVSSEASPARPDLDVASRPPCYWLRHSSAPPKDCVAAEASASRLDAVLDLERAQGVERRRLPGPGGVDTVQRLRAPARDAERHDRPDMAPPMRERFHCGRLQSDRRARSVRPRKAGMASPAGESEERSVMATKTSHGRDYSQAGEIVSKCRFGMHLRLAGITDGGAPSRRLPGADANRPARAFGEALSFTPAPPANERVRGGASVRRRRIRRGLAAGGRDFRR